MKAHFFLLIGTLGINGCVIPKSPHEPAPAGLHNDAPSPAATPIAVADCTYALLTPDATALVQVFDDGTSTFFRFEATIPKGLMIFDENGKPLPFAAAGAAVVVTTVRTGWLIRTPTMSSYAQAKSPARTARIEAFEGATSIPITPPMELAAARAEILGAQHRLAGLKAQLELATRRENDKPLAHIRGELEEIQTRLDGIDATLLRTHFASGRADLQLSDLARQMLIEAARAAAMVRIEGGADSLGTTQLNYQLALKRAHRVQDLLIMGGVAREKMSVVARVGEYVASNKTSEGRARNRRVDVVIVDGLALQDQSAPVATANPK